MSIRGANDMSYQTVFGSTQAYDKGGVQVIDANPKHYVFSNVFEVAATSKPYEKVAVAKNLKYVLEATRAEGVSPWFTASHDEAALVMDGEVEVRLIKPDQPLVPETKEGTVKLAAEPKGRNMGWIKASRGHMALLPKGAAYQFRAIKPGVMLLQTITGDCTVEKWADICQTA
jgi:quercetin dioxygenase-like cupin family protein